jgi:hypothetical protein
MAPLSHSLLLLGHDADRDRTTLSSMASTPIVEIFGDLCHFELVS